jgi:hypothetical protein
MSQIIEEWDCGAGLSAVRCSACQRTLRFQPARTVQQLVDDGHRPVYDDAQRAREGRRIAWLCVDCRNGQGPILRNP